MKNECGDLVFINGNHLVLFPTVAYHDQELNSWIADIHGWCFDAEEDANFQRATAGLLRRALKLPRDEQDPPFFRERTYGFVVESRKKIPIQVSHSQGSFILPKSKRNGHFRGVLDIQLSETPTNVSSTAHGSIKTTINAKRGDNNIEVCGDIHLIGDRGLSIISDIDDTIKFTNVGNKQEMLQNSFLKPFLSIEGMAHLFSKLASPKTSFHYISATPWQLYKPIAGFLSDHNFPEGSIHLRKFALKDITFLKKIFPAYKKKQNVIQLLILKYPGRRFLLFGDSGEKDPEMYGEIARKFPEQIAGIYIRNTTG
ncbi:MAG: App1 family protein, partial [Planctomycetaceae bacterium]|nr:App1 family protein [Planctomycetaceae bacterium]